MPMKIRCQGAPLSRMPPSQAPPWQQVVCSMRLGLSLPWRPRVFRKNGTRTSMSLSIGFGIAGSAAALETHDNGSRC